MRIGIVPVVESMREQNPTPVYLKEDVAEIETISNKVREEENAANEEDMEEMPP